MLLVHVQISNIVLVHHGHLSLVESFVLVLFVLRLSLIVLGVLSHYNIRLRSFHNGCPFSSSEVCTADTGRCQTEAGTNDKDNKEDSASNSNTDDCP